MFSKLKSYLGLIGAALAAFWLYVTAHKHGRAKGQKETLKEVQRAEKQRTEKQEHINAITNEATQKALDIDNSNATDEFNRLFERPKHKPKG